MPVPFAGWVAASARCTLPGVSKRKVTRDPKGDKLRKALRKAIEWDNDKDLINALRALEKHERREPRWPHRLGDALKRAEQYEEAEAAYLRAMKLFADGGFLPQSIALAKLVVALNPARTDVLDQIDQKATRALRGAEREVVEPPTLPWTKPAAPPPAPSEPPVKPPEEGESEQDRRPRFLPKPPRRPAATLPSAEDQPAADRPAAKADESPSFIGGIPREGMAVAAKALELAADASNDEVRYEDVSEDEWIELDPSDLEVITSPSVHGDDLPTPEQLQPWSGRRLTHLSATALFADVSKEALGKLARAAELLELGSGDFVCRRGEVADALFVIVEGLAFVVLPWLAEGGVDLAAGQVFGEASLLEEGTRQADVRAKGGLVLLRIDRSELRNIVAEHSEVHRLLFELLVKRLVVNTLQTGPLFTAFSMSQRRQLARMFEVRVAPRGVALLKEGKKSDALYLLLVGEFTATDDGRATPLPLGMMVGHRSLLSREPASRTVRATVESVVLRMPAKRFAQFAAQYPPVVEQLSKPSMRLMLS